MTLTDYFNILGLSTDSSIDEIKRAYRHKARQYHPDINSTPEAKDKFIEATEAYEFLLAYREWLTKNDDSYRQAMEDWRKYRQDRSRQRANAYARASYINFKRTKFYKTTRILDGTTVFLSLAISILVIVYTIIGYVYRVRHPLPGVQPALSFIMLLTMGMTFFIISLVFLRAYLESSSKHKKKH